MKIKLRGWHLFISAGQCHLLLQGFRDIWCPHHHSPWRCPSCRRQHRGHLYEGGGHPSLCCRWADWWRLCPAPVLCVHWAPALMDPHQDQATCSKLGRPPEQVPYIQIATSHKYIITCLYPISVSMICDDKGRFLNTFMIYSYLLCENNTSAFKG